MIFWPPGGLAQMPRYLNHAICCQQMLAPILFYLGQSRPSIRLFSAFLIQILITISIQIEKALMVCLGFEPGAIEWQAQTRPRSYGGRPTNPNSLSLMQKPTYFSYIGVTRWLDYFHLAIYNNGHSPKQVQNFAKYLIQPFKNSNDLE